MVPVIHTFRTAIVTALKAMGAPVVSSRGTHDDIISASILLQTSMARVGGAPRWGLVRCGVTVGTTSTGKQGIHFMSTPLSPRVQA
jgi:hypothetical protein